MITDVNCEESVTAKEDMTPCLIDNDISGAALNGRDPATLNVPKLKRWFV